MVITTEWFFPPRCRCGARTPVQRPTPQLIEEPHHCRKSGCFTLRSEDEPVLRHPAAPARPRVREQVGQQCCPLEVLCVVLYPVELLPQMAMPESNQDLSSAAQQCSRPRQRIEQPNWCDQAVSSNKVLCAFGQLRHRSFPIQQYDLHGTIRSSLHNRSLAGSQFRCSSHPVYHNRSRSGSAW